jgi:hypothetical protein
VPLARIRIHAVSCFLAREIEPGKRCASEKRLNLEVDVAVHRRSTSRATMAIISSICSVARQMIVGRRMRIISVWRRNSACPHLQRQPQHNQQIVFTSALAGGRDKGMVAASSTATDMMLPFQPLTEGVAL